MVTAADASIGLAAVSAVADAVSASASTLDHRPYVYGEGARSGHTRAPFHDLFDGSGADLLRLVSGCGSPSGLAVVRTVAGPLVSGQSTLSR